MPAATTDSLKDIRNAMLTRIGSSEAALTTTDTLDQIAEIIGDVLDEAGGGTRWLQAIVFDYNIDVAVGDGALYIPVPPSFHGRSLVEVQANVITAGVTNTTTIQLARMRAGVTVDMLSTRMTIDTTETSTTTAATPAVINSSNDDIVVGDVIRVDIDTISTTAPKGLILTLEFA